jgi:hypothetical protein
MVPDVGGMRLVECDRCGHTQFARRQIPRGAVNGKDGRTEAAGAIDARTTDRFAGTIILRGRVDPLPGPLPSSQLDGPVCATVHHGAAVLRGVGSSKLSACACIFTRIEDEVLALGARFEFVLDLTDMTVSASRRRPRFVARRVCEGKVLHGAV